MQFEPEPTRIFRKCKVQTARMLGRAHWLVLLIATVVTLNGQENQDDNQLKVGRSLDVFTRYGYLSLSMKVVPRNESAWLFREPTIDIFTGVDKYNIQRYRVPKTHRRVFNGDFHMEFCDNVKQLLQAYFRDFNFERFDKPWKAFTGSWSPELVAKNLGINSSFVHGEHCYVLVRLSRIRDSVKLSRIPNNINLTETVAREIDNITIGDVASVLMFMKKYGSHYIDSYVTGNSLYQVFVYHKVEYKQIKDRLKAKGISHINRLELGQYFGPWHAAHMGQIKVASGNKSVEDWAASKLRVNYYIFTYPNLLKIHGDLALLGVLNKMLLNEALLEMDMKTLAPAFKDPAKRIWFEEVLDNCVKLWESNL